MEDNDLQLIKQSIISGCIKDASYEDLKNPQYWLKMHALYAAVVAAYNKGTQLYQKISGDKFKKEAVQF